MIEFQRLVGFNFATYKKLDIPLANQGVTSIEGRNLDTGGSNGAGKSTPWTLLLEHVLYGTTSCGLSGDSIIGNHGKGYYGIVEWKSNGKEYQVIQWRGTCKYSEEYGKKLGIKIFEDGKSIEQGKNTTEIQKQVAQVIGLSHEEFLGSVLLSGEDHVLLKGRPSDRIAFLSGPFKLYIYDLILKEVKNDLKELDDRFRKLEVVQAKKERAEEELNKLGSLRQASADLDAYKSKLKKLQRKVDTLKQNRDKVLKRLTILNDIDIEEFEKTDIGKSEKELKLLKEGVSKLESKIRNRTVYLQKVEEYEEIQAKLKKAKSVDVAALESKIKKLTKEIATMEAEYTSQITTISKFSRVKGKATCPTCHRDFSPKDVKNIKKLVQTAEEKAEALRVGINDAKSALKNAEEKKKKGAVYEKLKAKLPESVQKGDTSEKIYSEIDALDKKLESMKTRKDKLTDTLNQVKAVATKLKQLNVTAKNLETTITTLETEKELYDDQLGTLEDKVSNIKAKIEKIEDTLEERETIAEEIKKYDKKLKLLSKLKRKESLLRVLEEAYGSRGLKLDKIRAIIARFQQILPKYTSILFTEKDIRFEVKGDDKKLGFMAIRPKSKPFDIKALSRGESRRMNLALILMTKYAMPASKSTNLVVLDEVDTNMDDIGKDALVNELIPSLKERIGTIIIISHNKEISQSPTIDNRWIAEKKNELSRMIMKENV